MAPRKGTGTKRSSGRKSRSKTYQGNAAYRNPKRPRRAGSGGGRRRTKPERMLSRRGITLLIGRLIFMVFILGGLTVMYYATQLPDIRALDTIKKQQGITIETVDGRVIANYGDVYGNYIPYEQLPKSLVYAVIATEDRRFFEHHGVDIIGITRAMVTNVRAGRLVQGGSTVTQQVAKNVFLTPERSLSRKVQELLLAFWLEARFTKQEIMAIYLNRVYLGAGAFGVDAAAKRYFNKSARDLNLYESALMAGLLKAPSRYSPAANTDRAQARVHQVLVNMVDAGYLKKKEVAPALASYEKSPAHESQGGDVRYFTDWIVDTIPTVVGQVNDDMVVTTTLDTTMQEQAQDAIVNVVTMEGEKKRVTQGALVAMKPDGAVQALVGGMSYAKSQYNRASQAKRQPGSVFKLFVYLAALEAGLNPQSMVEDAPITLQVGNKMWSPENFGMDYRGQIPMVEAIRFSLNTVSVRLSQFAGVNRVAEIAMRLGIPNVPDRPSIALGAVEATLVEMTGAYAHLANGGAKVEPYGILRVRTRAGKEIYKREEPDRQMVLAKGTVEMMNYLLLDVVARGTAVKANLPGRQVAGKTGTSQDFKDAWFIGYTGQMVTGVWVGNDNNKPMRKVTGGSVPATIWRDFMVKAMEGQPVKYIPSSAGSSEGLLPWLFGGSTTVDGEGTVVNGEAGAPTGMPQYPGINGVPITPEAMEQPSGADDAREGNGDVLTPEFWDKLMEKVPEKDKVEYTYPGEDKRRR